MKDYAEENGLILYKWRKNNEELGEINYADDGIMYRGGRMVDFCCQCVWITDFFVYLHTKKQSYQNYMRKILTTLWCMMLASTTMHAQSMRQMWIDMPDSLTVFLNKSLRTELADYVDMKVTPEVNNLLKEKTVIDTLTADYLRVKLSAASEMELKLLPRKSGDTIICMVRTYYGPVAQSVLTCYDRQWHPLEGTFMRKLTRDDFISKPATMSQERYNDLIAMTDWQLTAFHLSPAEPSLQVSMGFLQLTKEDQQDFDTLLTQTKLNWNGEVFK